MKGLLRLTAGATLLGASTLAQAGLFSQSEPEMYIVQLEPSALVGQTISEATAAVLGLVGAEGAVFEYDTVLTGFAAPLTERQVRLLKRLPLVSAIEKDSIVQATGTQNNPIYGLDRIDEYNRPTDGVYQYPASAGAGVHVYIVDTGINADHVEFTGRIGQGQNFVSDGPGGLARLLPLPVPLPLDIFGLLGGGVDPEAWDDCNGHGTHVASTAGGTQWGVAKQATLHAVRVLGCSGSGSTSGVIAGMEWVAENAEKPAVANMSLGGGSSAASDAAVRALYNAGVVPVVAAGNDNADACNSSPGREPLAFNVVSSDSQDRESSFSNHGTCTDIIAPGSSIVAASHTSNTGSATLSGTSMAAPHVAGAAALILGETPSLSVADVYSTLLSNATPGKIALSPANVGTPNLLLNVFPEGAKD
nr:S8 family peptidase [Oceanococcus sp. HetDA_MAG_MS8]